MKPWHLHSEQEREDVIRWIADAVPPADMDGDYGTAWEAAIAVLRDAAPMPDEVLVVSVQRWQDEGPTVMEIVDAKDGCVALADSDGDMHDAPGIWPSTHWWPIDSRIRPLTPAAAEFLAALGGGE